MYFYIYLIIFKFYHKLLPYHVDIIVNDNLFLSFFFSFDKITIFNHINFLLYKITKLSLFTF